MNKKEVKERIKSLVDIYEMLEDLSDTNPERLRAGLQGLVNTLVKFSGAHRQEEMVAWLNMLQVRAEIWHRLGREDLYNVYIETFEKVENAYKQSYWTSYNYDYKGVYGDYDDVVSKYLDAYDSIYDVEL